MDPLKILSLAGSNGWTCLAFAIGCLAWLLDRRDSRQHQREHREAATVLQDNPLALAKLPDGGTVPSGRQAALPLAVLAILIGLGALASVGHAIAIAKDAGRQCGASSPCPRGQTCESGTCTSSANATLSGTSWTGATPLQDGEQAWEVLPELIDRPPSYIEVTAGRLWGVP